MAIPKDVFVFDCVCHIFNFDKSNAFDSAGDLFDEHLYAFHAFLTKEGEKVIDRDDFFREWSVDEIYDMVIEESDTDMIVSQRGFQASTKVVSTTDQILEEAIYLKRLIN